MNKLLVERWMFEALPVHAKSLHSCPTLCHPKDLAHQAALSMGFSRQEYWSGLPCSPPGDLPNPGIEPMSLMSPELAGGLFTKWGKCNWKLKKRWFLLHWSKSLDELCLTVVESSTFKWWTWILAEAILKQNFKGMAWFLFAGYSKMWQEEDIEKRTVLQKWTSTSWFWKLGAYPGYKKC